MGVLLLGVPLMILALTAAAFVPVRPVDRRVPALLLLLLALAGFVLWRSSDGGGTGAAVIVAPAVLVTLMRLMIDVFTMLAQRLADTADDEPADQSG